MRLRKELANGLFIALLLMSLATVASAIEWDGVPDDPTPAQAIWVDPKNIACLEIGDTFVIDVLINITSPTSTAGTGIFGWEYKLGWDPSVIDTSQSASTPHVLPGTGFTVADDWTVSGRHWFAFSLLVGDAFAGVMSLCTYTFEVVGDGSSVLDLYDTEVTDDTATMVISDGLAIGTTADGIYCPAPVEYELTIGVVGSGTTDPAPGSYMYDEDTLVEVDAIPDVDWMLDHWELDAVDVGDADPYEVTMDDDHTLTAVFTEIPPVEYELTIGVVGSGSTDPVPGSYMYVENTVVSVDAIPDAGWMLDYWELDMVDVGADDPYDVTMDANHTLTAVFAEIPVVVPVTASEEGNFTAGVDAGTDKGAPVTSWTEISTTNIASYTVTLTEGDTVMVVTGQLEDPTLEGQIVLEVDPVDKIITYEIIIAPFVAPAPTIESCDLVGVQKDTFDLDETVYVTGSGYAPSIVAVTTYDIHVVNDVTWSDGMPIPDRVPGTATTVTSDSLGNISPTPVWSDPLTPGKYDIVVDVNGNGDYDEGIDALDDMDIQETAGFFVIPEYVLGTIVGLIACFAAFGVFLRFRRLHRV